MHLEVPRVPGRAELLVGPPAPHGKLHGMGLSQHNHARRNHLLHQRGGGGRAAVSPSATAAGGHAPLDLHDILDRHRDAVQRADAMARRHGVGRGFCRHSSIVCVHFDEGMELVVVTGNALEIALDDIHRADLTPGHSVTQPVHRFKRELRHRGHDLSPRSIASSLN